MILFIPSRITSYHMSDRAGDISNGKGAVFNSRRNKSCKTFSDNMCLAI